MVSLTHVCMWSENDWKPITAEEADKLHPGGTVSAHSGLFMCELCNQYVILTGGTKRRRYFKHSAYEKSKDCPERIIGAGCSVSYNPQDYDLPIRITGVSSNSFSFELGLIRAPITNLSKDFQIKIRPLGANDIGTNDVYEYAKERLNRDSITYLPIGYRPFENYMLSFKNGNDRLREFWPEKIRGIEPRGTLFEKASGKRLSYDADVVIGQEYYLLIRGNNLKKSRRNVQIQEVSKKSFGWEQWILYVVSASAYNEDTARFYLDFHYRLTDCPISLQPVWPLFVEGNYLIKHSQPSMYMLVNGNVASFKTFPAVKTRQLSSKVSRQCLYKVPCSGRQQLISAGRRRVLQYTYLWKEDLNYTGQYPSIVVTDLTGSEIAPGEAHVLPHHRTLLFKLEFDGEIVVLYNNRVVEKRKADSDKQIELDRLSYGMSIQAVIGLDVIWEISFKKRQTIVADDGSELLKEISHMSGAQIPTPHALRNILISMNCYPKVSQWIRERLKIGTINAQAYRKLQQAYRSLNSDR